MPARVLGPPTIVSGTGFFEYFLPLMAILGDIIEVHHRRQHPRLGRLDDTQAVAIIGEMLATCERSLDNMVRKAEMENGFAALPASGPSISDLGTGMALPTTAPAPGALPTSGSRHSAQSQDRSRLQMVTAYSAHILHVLHVLLHGKWDAICMLDDDDDWITSTRFNDCASHAIAASQAVSRILESDPELTFMPYLFGIYLLHGSFILLLFADRMPQLGPNQSVEQACETIIRAHEVCVVTLSTEFQVRRFRFVTRAHERLTERPATEKLPQGPALDTVQRSRIEPRSMGGAQREAKSALAVSVDQGRQGSGIMRPADGSAVRDRPFWNPMLSGILRLGEPRNLCPRC